MVRSANRGYLQIPHVDSSLLRSVPPGPALLTGLLVRCEVEGDEEEEVRAENAHTSERGKFLASAFTAVWQVGKVGGCEISVRGEVDETWGQSQ